MKRLFLVVVAVLLVALTTGFVYLRGRRFDYTITQAQIDDALRTRFPITKKHLLIFEITYSNPKATLLPDSDRIEVALDALLNVRIGSEPQNLGGSIVAIAGVAYRDEAKKFYLSDPVIKELRIQGIPPQHLDKVTAFASKVATDYLPEIPVYTIKATDAKATAAKLLLKDVQVKSSEIHLTLGL
jgi:hypothetical protein